MVGKMLGGELAGLAGSIAGSKGKAEQDFCLAAIETAKKGGKAASPRKEKGAVERTTGGVKERRTRPGTPSRNYLGSSLDEFEKSRHSGGNRSPGYL